MFRKISLTALALASAVALAPNANASTATATVSFSGTVANSCSFGSPSGTGVLTPFGSTQINNNINGITITLTCNTPSSLGVGNPTNNGSTEGTSTPTSNSYAKAVLPTSDECFNPSTTVVFGTSSTSCSSIPAGSTQLTVYMALEFGNAPTAGTYNYSTTLTATYN